MKLYQTTLPGGAQLTGYLREPAPEMPLVQKRPAVLILPGGGYEYCSVREADPVAMQFLSAGYQAFVLLYTTAGSKDVSLPLGWQPVCEAAQAIAHIRANAERFHLRENSVAVCGFSAGGHLAASVSMLWDAAPVREAVAALAAGGEANSALYAQPAAARPDAAILSYPVITAGPYAHRGSFTVLCGQDETLLARFSLEHQVRPDMPPCFVWHDVTDETVPVENALMLAAELQKQKISYELHLFRQGVHGESICTAEVNTPNRQSAHWLPLCAGWLADVLDYHVV